MEESLLETKNKVAMVFKLGDLVDAKDQSNCWYKSRVIDTDENRVKVHFLGWNARYDQWFDLNTGSIRATASSVSQSKQSSIINSEKILKTKKQKKNPIIEKKEETVIVKTTETKNVVSDEEKHAIGKQIGAKWIDENFYPARVYRHVMKSTVLYYEVKFFDGVKKLVRHCNTKELTPEQIEQDSVSPSTTSLEQKNKEEEIRRAEAELLLAIQKPHLKKEAIEGDEKDTIATKQTIQPSIAENTNVRKSGRVKRPKTFKDEIVFYSDTSTPLTYNSAAVAVAAVENISSTISASSSKRIRLESEQTTQAPQITMPSLKQETIKEDNKNKVQSYFKSLKMFKAKRSVVGSKKKETKRKTTEATVATVAPKLEKSVRKMQENLLRKKQRKDKKKLIKKLIESSQLQLRKQQELIEQQLKRHQYRKSKKKLLRMLRRQQRLEEEKKPINTFSRSMDNISELSLNMSVNVDSVNASAPLVIASSGEPIRCNYSNCDKVFRKQSLLEYHLKYHHYVNVKCDDIANGSTKNVAAKRRHSLMNQSSGSNNKASDTIDSDFEETLNDVEEDDPYDIVHCKCGDHTTNGFMIQCEICLCWQHGECLNVTSTANTPKHHLCWICSEPGNKLKKLKYQSWMKNKLENGVLEETIEIKKDNELSEQEKPLISNSVSTENLNSDSSTLTVEIRPTPSKILMENSFKSEDKEKLRLLNVCSRKYYKLNLLMYTLEYQMSLLNQLTSSKQQQENKNRAANKAKNLNLTDQKKKLILNITHLQECALKKFNDFNSRLDEFETKYQSSSENLLPRFFNLQELYKQLKSFVYNK